MKVDALNDKLNNFSYSKCNINILKKIIQRKLIF